VDVETVYRLFDQLDEEHLVAKLTGFPWDAERARRTQALLAEAGFSTRWDVPRETQQEDPRLLAP
jgi:hypothetical protein